MSKHYLVTGGAGFIGSNYVNRLLGRGERVTVYDNLSRAGGPLNIEWLRQTHGRDSFELVVGDLRDASLLTATARHADVIIHLAGQVAVTTSVLHPREDFEDNALGTFNVLEAARLSGRNPVVLYASTNKVYGGMEDVRLVERETCYEYADFPHGIPETQPLDFHSPYGCCYSSDTDILTSSGWKRFYELTPEDEVLTYNIERKVAKYQLPTDYFAYLYQGKMYVQNNCRLKTCVTPKHKMLVSWGCNHDELERPQLMEAQEIAGKPMAYLLAANVVGGDEQEYFVLPAVKAGKHKHSFPDRKILMNDWLRFLGWYIAEGHCYESKKTGNCTVTLTSYYRADEAIAVMKAIGLSPVLDNHHITATSRQLFEYLKHLGKSHDKYIPENIKSLPGMQLVILLNSLLDGDGNKQSKNNWKYTTVSVRLANDVQEITIKCGLASSLTLDKEGFYRVYINTTKTTLCNLGEDRSEWIDYDGMVYCVEVPNSVVMVRQNGRAYFSGNSKGAGDQYLRDYQRIYGLPTVVLRQSCIYGPRQFGIEDQGWVAWFVIAAVAGKPITIFGDGKQVRDALYIEDLLDAYDAAIERIDTVAGQVYNIGGGPEKTISIWKQFGPILEKLLGQKISVAWEDDWRPGDQLIYVSDIRKAGQELGWKPQIGVEAGIQRLFEWVTANRDLFS
ncbi:MAG: NAD-dependent epimerase/dehydratase family protein [Chloroflexota bacterium]